MKRGKILWLQHPLPLSHSPSSCPHPLPISFVIKYNLESNFQLVSPSAALSNFNVNIVFSVRRHRHRHRQLIGFRGSSKRKTKQAGGKKEKKEILHKKRRKRLNFLVTRKWEETTKVKINIELLIHNKYLIRTHTCVTYVCTVDMATQKI